MEAEDNALEERQGGTASGSASVGACALCTGFTNQCTVGDCALCTAFASHFCAATTAGLPPFGMCAQLWVGSCRCGAKGGGEERGRREEAEADEEAPKVMRMSASWLAAAAITNARSNSAEEARGGGKVVHCKTSS